MQLRFMCFVLCFTTGFVSTEKQCRMPDGNAGECKLLEKCKPLFELNKKKSKTNPELLYLRQSSCGQTSSFKFLIYNTYYINAIRISHRYKETIIGTTNYFHNDGASSGSTDDVIHTICCPPESQWSTFNGVKPVLIDEIMKYETEDKEKQTANNNNDINGGNELQDKYYTNKPEEDKILPFDYKMQNDSFECGRDSFNSNRITGGSIAAIDEYPWLILLEYEFGKTSCGGSLITTRYVLTAAHCIKRQKEPKFARLAEYNTSSYPTDLVEVDGGGLDEITVQIIPIEKNIAHPNYTKLSLHYHDIGLSKLKTDAVLGDFIRLICLPTRDFTKDFKRGLNLTVAGWGSDGTKFSEVKKYVSVPYVPNKQCQLSSPLFNGIIDSQICAGGRENEDSCSGDSGGPLMYELNSTYIAIGIVSFGISRCGTENVPAVYTHVYSYLDWLNDNMV